MEGFDHKARCEKTRERSDPRDCSERDDLINFRSNMCAITWVRSSPRIHLGPSVDGWDA